MTAVELIQKKRDGGRLSANEIRWLISGFTSGSVPDYQMAAMAMAVYLNGLSHEELAVWTEAMMHSGDVLELSAIAAPKVDTHSTGGVGDKVSIPMMSGRGLGHTGGTLDKLETIPGFTTNLDPSTFERILSKTGLVLAGQSETLVPADRKLYALRDATGTVESIPLISSSIMSKKLAEDLDGLVLDVKVGRGAFMKDVTQARLLAETMVGIGSAHGTKVVALLTGMDQPLGHEVGNALEVRESIDVLKGEGPADLTEVTLALGVEMLLLAGVSPDEADARAQLETSVTSGRALELFGEVIEAQGGDPSVIDDPTVLPAAPHREKVGAEKAGTLRKCDALDIAVAAMRLGAGRERKEDSIDPGVGITVHHKVGDQVTRGEPLATIHYRESEQLEHVMALVLSAFEIGDAIAVPPLIIDRVEAG